MLFLIYQYQRESLKNGCIKTLSDDKISYWSKLKTSEDDIGNLSQMTKYISHNV